MNIHRGLWGMRQPGTLYRLQGWRQWSGWKDGPAYGMCAVCGYWDSEGWQAAGHTGKCPCVVSQVPRVSVTGISTSHHQRRLPVQAYDYPAPYTGLLSPVTIRRGWKVVCSECRGREAISRGAGGSESTNLPH